jgi:hypothetical protein
MTGTLPSEGERGILFKGGIAMKQPSKWNLRSMQCPEGEGKTELLLEWKVEKGKKVLCSVSCNNPRLTHYSGTDCKWICLEKISGAKKS